MADEKEKAPAKAEAKAAPAPEAPKSSVRRFKVTNHLSHNEKHYKIGDEITEEHMTADQMEALLKLKTIQEVKE